MGSHTQYLDKMSVSHLLLAITSALLVYIPSVVKALNTEGNTGGGGNIDPPGALDPEQAEFIKSEIQRLSTMTKEGQVPSGVDLHQLMMMMRLNIETEGGSLAEEEEEHEGRDGFSEFPGSPTIIIQANGEVRIKDKEGILLSQDGKFNDAMFDTVFGEYRKMFEEILTKQEGLMRQIKKLQKQVERDQKGAITQTFAHIEFTFLQNGTTTVSRQRCERETECITDRAFFDGEIDEDIFNEIFPQDVLAKLTVEEATGSSLDTKADGTSEPESEPELGASTAAGSGGYKNFVSGTTVFFILSTIYFS